jgi:hypothetical protein
MFQFPGFASVLRQMTGLTTSRVAPFGHLGIIACVPLPRAFRSLPRPSSPPCAQASPTCLRLLDYIQPLVKQSTRDLSTSDNLAKVSQFRFAIPRSTTNFRCQTATPSAARVRGSWSNRNWELDVEACDHTVRFSALGRAERLLTCSVKEVIQPQVPLRLPCYDFAPVTALAFGRLVPCGFRHGLRALTASMA